MALPMAAASLHLALLSLLDLGSLFKSRLVHSLRNYLVHMLILLFQIPYHHYLNGTYDQLLKNLQTWRLSPLDNLYPSSIVIDRLITSLAGEVDSTESSAAKNISATQTWELTRSRPGGRLS